MDSAQKISEDPCQFKDNKILRSQFFYDDAVSVLKFNELLEQGFRRSGAMFYRYACDGCNACQSLRVDVQNFVPSKSQRRVWRRCQDIELKLLQKPTSKLECSQLFNKYITLEHSQRPMTAEEFDAYYSVRFIFSRVFEFRLGAKLVAITWLDITAEGLNSVYAAYDPEFKQLGLGTYTALAELAFAKEQGLLWYYLGYWLEGKNKLSYKSQFRPNQVFNGQWVSLEGLQG